MFRAPNRDPTPNVGEEDWNYWQNRWREGVPIGADRDPPSADIRGNIRVAYGQFQRGSGWAPVHTRVSNFGRGDVAMSDEAAREGPRVRLRDLMPVVDLTREMGTGPFRTRRPCLCRPAAPRATTLVPPARTSKPGSPLPKRANTAQPGKCWCATTPCRRCTAASATHPCEQALQSRCARRRGQHPRGRALSRRPRSGGGVEAADRRSRRAASAVLVVGAGPSGLSAAYHLARLGHAVEIHEAGPVPGGMMHFGIPAYRLPRALI